jgi:large subunit ribosomal protein L25
VLYGPKTKPILLSVDFSDIEQALKKSRVGQVLVNLVIHNGDTTTRPAMIKELQVHPVSRNYLHVDFYEIEMDQKIRVKVPVDIKGKSKGVEVGGILQVIRRELEVLCLPTEIPDAFVIDVTELDIGDSIHVEEIPLEGDIEIPAEVNFTVVTVLSPKIEEVVEEEEEGEEEELEEGEEAREPGESPEEPE